MMKWFLLSLPDNLVICGLQISVRSMAMSPALLAVVIFDCRWRKEEIKREKQGQGIAPSA